MALTEPRPAAGREQWKRLEDMVARASRMRGLRSLSEEELLEFGRLYRRAAAELAHAQSYGLDAAELQYLNWLVGRAYGLLYVTESSGWAGVKRFYRAELPQTLRRHGGLIALSAAILLGAAAVGALLTSLRPDLLEIINPQLAGMLDGLARRHAHGRDFLPSEVRPFASSMIITNNLQVSFTAFSLGLLAGVGTVLILLYNGFFLGVLAAGISRTAASVFFWSFVAPHGVIELPAIMISAAAGLLLGLALLDPGEHSRIDALRLAGRQAGVMMLGVVTFLLIAGIVEGFFSPAVIPPTAKFVVAAILAAAFWGYIVFAGRGEEKPTTAPAP